MSLKTRKIDDAFLNQLIDGALTPLLAYVRNDHTLDMELRGESVMIYYRGGKILEVFNGKNNGGLAEGYLAGKDPDFVLPSPDDFKNYFPAAKHLMDVHMVDNEAWEKDIQQRIVIENNYSSNSMDTDFFIIDTEYQDPDLKSRFDLVALRWESDPVARKLPKNHPPKITIFEIKQGFNSIRGESGLRAHLDDFEKFIGNEEKKEFFKADMLAVLDQKRRLGLFGKEERKRYTGKIITEVDADIDFVLLLANYKPASDQVKNELAEISVIENIKFMFSNPMGYGLYADNAFSAGKLPWQFHA